MIRGLYTGATGMVAQMHRLDTVSNNLANVDTTGYKRDQAVHKSFSEMLIRRFNDTGVYIWPFGSSEVAPVVGKLGLGVEMNESYTIFSQGAMKITDNPFDLALEEAGFFVVQTPEGLRYTRNGSFHLGPEGLLVTKEGYPVLGENGPITIKENNFVVDGFGRVYHNATFASDPERLVSMQENQWENTEYVDRLRIVNFEETRYLKKQGDSLWMETDESGVARELVEGQDRPKVRQGFLETSNVNPVREMVEMIEVNRSYEANQRVIQTLDSMMGKLINEAMRL